MEFNEEHLAQFRRIETSVVIFFTGYGIYMIIDILTKKANTWEWIAILGLLIVAWGIFLSKYHSFQIRNMLTTLLISASVLIFSLNKRDLEICVFAYAIMTLCIAFYGVAAYIYIAGFTAFIMFIAHIHQLRLTDQLESQLESTILLGVHVFLFTATLYFWLSKRQEGQRRLQQTMQALIRAEKSKGDFLANVSHEVRTPLNTILGMSDMILADDDIDQIHAEVRSIQTAGQNLMNNVMDILDYSELQEGKIDIRNEIYTVSSSVNDMINNAMVQRGDKDLNFIVNLDSSIPKSLQGDERKIRRVIMNLLSNAFKFTHEGYVQLDVSGRREGDIWNLIITIIDSGIGMSPENKEKVLQHFGQVDTKRNRSSGGIGLGLGISKMLVDRMGGTLIIRSQEKKGTEVQVVIPQKIVEEEPICVLENSTKINVLLYANFEEFGRVEIRDAYYQNILHITKNLGIKYHICQSLQEFKRRVDSGEFTNIMVTNTIFNADKEYFDQLSKESSLSVIMIQDDLPVDNPNVYPIEKPFYILSVANIFRGQTELEAGRDMRRAKEKQFLAPNAHILVVDDNETNLMIISDILESYQIKVTTATSGVEALEKIQSMNYDFVFMDHMMPGMDGVETFHKIRDKVGSYYQKVPVVALTANAVSGARNMFISEGFADYMEKPIEISVLERVLHRNIPEEKLRYYLPTEAPSIKEDTAFVDEASKTEARQTWVEKEERPKTSDTLQSQKASGQSKAQEPKETKELIIGNLDVPMGIMYCGSEKSFIKVLAQFILSAPKVEEEIRMYFNQEDWDNYIICVHGLKSSSMSLGAKELSAKAKELELAGKAGQYQVIYDNHGEMLEEYARVIAMTSTHPLVNEEILRQKPEVASKDEQEDLKEISSEDFDELVFAFEDASYDLDQTKMLEILEKLEGFMYKDNPLGKETTEIRQKVNESDLMSAGEAMTKLRQQLG